MLKINKNNLLEKWSQNLIGIRLLIVICGILMHKLCIIWVYGIAHITKI